METLPITYRDYTIKRGEHTKFEFVHNEYDGPEDNRIGVCSTIDECRMEIDSNYIEMLEKENEMLEQRLKTQDSGSYRYDDALFKAVAELTKPAEEEPKSSLHNLLHHSPKDLLVAMVAIKNEAERLYDQREGSRAMADAYTALCAWAKIFDTAINEKKELDSIAWAEKTAKEIKETLTTQ